MATSASSGIAATLLHLGRTSHNQFKLPFTPHKDSYCNIKSQSELVKFLQNMKLAIFDEGPMLNKLCFEALIGARETWPRTNKTRTRSLEKIMSWSVGIFDNSYLLWIDQTEAKSFGTLSRAQSHYGMTMW